MGKFLKPNAMKKKEFFLGRKKQHGSSNHVPPIEQLSKEKESNFL
jgi:hypothetical protein